MNPNQLLTHFNRISEAPDAIPRLRRFILDLAVRGKLVEQDPRDEPASMLMKRIAAEKVLLAKQGEIRKQELLKDLDKSDIPFELPQGWLWSRLGNIGDWGSGSTPPRGNSEYYGGEITWLKSGELGDCLALKGSEERVSEVALQKCSFRLNQPGDVLIAMYGATIGKLAILAEPAVTNQAVCGCTPFSGILNRYLFTYLLSRRADFHAQSEGGAQPNISKVKIVMSPFPLPPLAEQHRIVAKVDELMALCDRLEAAQKERENRRDRLVASTLHRLNNGADADAFREHARFYFNHLPRLTTRPDHIKQLRQTILNLAVRGKLVPQDPNDEPASELLKRIQAEKARLVKEGTIRKQNPQGEIAADEVPFALPDQWEWVRLGNVIHLVSGQHLQPSEYSGQKQSGPPYITGPADFGQNGLVITRYAVVRKSVAQKGQILLTVKGAGVGKTAICDLPEVAISRQLMAMNAIEWSQQFLLLATHRLAEALKESARSLIPGISREDVDQFIFPLPPLAEQHRIVAKVEELMTLCNQLETQLTTTQTESRHLLEAVLYETLA